MKTPYFPHRVRGLRTEVQKPRAMPYKDDAEPLNELLVIGRQSLQAMENLIAVAEYKRNDDRNEYQRKFMAATRRRFKLAFELEARRIGRDLTLDERTRFMHELQAQWSEERDAYVVRRTEQVQQQIGAVSHDDKREFISQFWDMKTQELLAMMSEAKPPALRKKKRVVEVAKPQTAMASALTSAIDKKK
ncbi:hypothetical protein [Paraburkholderia unamae]|uniref:Uncharacterized protein n=1 Tax=Paraburkholderia unamae TaxID=219649 RepID=A0ACC6RGJ9_9BURK